MKRNCLLCGDEFESNIKSKVFCKSPHPVKCHYCGLQIVKKPKKGEEIYTCGSMKCRSERTKETNLKRYGVTNVAGAKEVQEKIKKTNIERYGTEHTFQAESVKNKIKESNISKYGTENPRWHNKESREKAEKTNTEKYGSKNPFGSEEIKEKIKKTNVERYGSEWNTQSEEINEKRRKTYLERYNVDNPAKSTEIKEKAKKTTLERYGKENFMQTEEGKAKMKAVIFGKYGVENINHIGIKNYNEFLHLEEFINSQDESLSLTKISEYFNIHRKSLKRRIIKLGLEDKFHDFVVISSKEDEFENMIKNLGVRYKRNDRKILKGKELDFLFPDLKIAVEISPTHTHNSKTGYAGRGSGLPSNYHIKKFKECEKQGIELITVFDWYEIEKVFSMVKSKANINSNKIYGRETKYEEVNLNKEIVQLVSEWHIMGLSKNTNKNKIVGMLKHEGDIVAIAVWDPLSNNCTELKRLAFKPDVSVIGGTSKLIENFKRNNPSLERIITYSNSDLGSGLIYKKVGFELKEESKQNLNYYNEKYEMRIKSKTLSSVRTEVLLNFLPKKKKANENLSQREILEEQDFLPIYDCGYKKWELNIQKSN